MIQTLPFNDHVAEYEAWFEKYPAMFQSEVVAIKELLPPEENLRGLEVGTGTGRFADALGIMEAVEPADNMRRKAIKRGIIVRDGEAENLPFEGSSFDYLLMAFCISYFQDIQRAFKEAYRTLKWDGCLLVGFIDQDSVIGREYEARKPFSLFYREARFYAPEFIIGQLKKAGFSCFSFVQTLFRSIEDTRSVELPKPGFGEGSFVVIKAIKRRA